jgi:predicted anti-sigma-YlaC factor YlaD
MNGWACENARDRIPDWVAGALGRGEREALDGHFAECGECRAERDLVALLAEGRPVAPAGMAVSIEESVRGRRRSVANPWWGLAAASVAAVALGIGIASDAASPLPEVPAYVAVIGESAGWLSDDGFVAGAPALGDLSDEALLTLLEEMAVTPSGGAA